MSAVVSQTKSPHPDFVPLVVLQARQTKLNSSSTSSKLPLPSPSYALAQFMIPPLADQVVRPETWELPWTASSSPISPHEWPYSALLSLAYFCPFPLRFLLSLPRIATPHPLPGLLPSSLPSSMQSDHIQCQPNHGTLPRSSSASLKERRNVKLLCLA